MEKINDNKYQLEPLKKKQILLEQIDNEIKLKKRRLNRLSNEKKILQQKNHLKKIIAAGKIFEEIGILYNYDKEEIKKLLLDYKEKFLKG